MSPRPWRSSSSTPWRACSTTSAPAASGPATASSGSRPASPRPSSPSSTPETTPAPPPSSRAGASAPANPSPASSNAAPPSGRCSSRRDESGAYRDSDAVSRRLPRGVTAAAHLRLDFDRHTLRHWRLQSLRWRGWHDSVRHRLAGDHQHPLVALQHLGQEALNHRSIWVAARCRRQRMPMVRRFDPDRLRYFRRFVWQRFVDDKCFETAGALSYTTLVSLVPLTVAVLAMFAVFPVFEGARDTLINFVFNNFVPAAGEKVQAALQSFADNAKGLTGVSILIMLFSALSMMISIEDRLNRIWRVHQPRRWSSRLLLYWAALTLGPILVGGGIAATSYVTAMPFLSVASDRIHTIGSSLLATLPFLVTFFTLWLMYAVIPNTRVSRRDAAIGALLGAVLFEIARWGFGQFVGHAQTYQQIYGVLATIPIFLLWIYLSWVIVILAASIAASISAYEYLAPSETLPAAAEFLGLLVVLGMFVDAQRRGESVDLADVRLHAPYLSAGAIGSHFDDLQQADLIQRGEAGGWLLSRSLDSTDLLRLYGCTRCRLPLRPLEEAASMGIELPSELLQLLDDLGAALQTKLGTRLDQIYPPSADPAADTEELPA